MSTLSGIAVEKMDLRIGAVNTPGSLVSDCAFSKICPKRGVAMDLALETCKFLRLNCTFEWYTEGKYGRIFENGTADGLLGEIQKGVYDASVPNVIPSESRMRAVSFSSGYFSFDTGLITRLPSRGHAIDWGIFHVYHWAIVCALVCTIGLIVVAMAGSVWVTTNANKNFGSIFFESLQQLLSLNCDSVRLKLSSVRILLSLWGLVTLILYTEYTTVLFSKKIATIEPPFTDFETFVQCLEEGRCQVVMPPSQPLYQQMLTAPGNPISDRINRALKYNPMRFVPDSEILQAILEEKRKYLVLMWNSERVTTYLPAGESCNFYVVNTPFSMQAAVAVTKGHPVLESLNRMAFYVRSAGIEKAIKSRYSSAVECGPKMVPRADELTENGIWSIIAIFYVYGLGISGAWIVFGLEQFFRFGRRSSYELWKE